VRPSSATRTPFHNKANLPLCNQLSVQRPRRTRILPQQAAPPKGLLRSAADIEIARDVHRRPERESPFGGCGPITPAHAPRPCRPPNSWSRSAERGRSKRLRLQRRDPTPTGSSALPLCPGRYPIRKTSVEEIHTLRSHLAVGAAGPRLDAEASAGRPARPRSIGPSESVQLS
jgi:hypothetical protein